MRPMMILAIATLVLGVIFVLGAVSGFFFEAPTPVDDIGLYAVFVVFLVLGGAGVWAALVDKRVD